MEDSVKLQTMLTGPEWTENVTADFGRQEEAATVLACLCQTCCIGGPSGGTKGKAGKWWVTDVEAEGDAIRIRQGNCVDSG